MSNADNREKRELKRLIESIVTETLIKEGDDVIYKAFIQPFTDVVDTAVHGAKTMATKTGSDLLKVAKLSTMSLLPWVGPRELDNIESQFDQRLNSYLDGLDQEYKDVLDRNIQNLGTTDAMAFSFFLRPDLFFAKQIATGTPVVALDMLDTLTLGNAKVRNLKNKLASIHKRKDPVGSGGGPMSGGGGYGDYMGGDMGGDAFEEAVQPQQQQRPNPKLQMKKELEALLKDPEIIQAMKDNPIVKDMAKMKAQAAIDRASELMGAKTFDDIKKHVGKDAASLETQATKDFPPNVSPEEKMQLLDAMVPEFKKMYGQIYKSYLTNLLNLDAMFPDDIRKAVAKLDQLG